MRRKEEERGERGVWREETGGKVQREVRVCVCVLKQGGENKPKEYYKERTIKEKEWCSGKLCVLVRLVLPTHTHTHTHPFTPRNAPLYPLDFTRAFFVVFFSTSPFPRTLSLSHTLYLSFLLLSPPHLLQMNAPLLLPNNLSDSPQKSYPLSLSTEQDIFNSKQNMGSLYLTPPSTPPPPSCHQHGAVCFSRGGTCVRAPTHPQPCNRRATHTLGGRKSFFPEWWNEKGKGVEEEEEEDSVATRATHACVAPVPLLAFAQAGACARLPFFLSLSPSPPPHLHTQTQTHTLAPFKKGGGVLCVVCCVLCAVRACRTTKEWVRAHPRRRSRRQGRRKREGGRHLRKRLWRRRRRAEMW